MANCDRCIFGKNEDDCFPHVAEDRECSMFRIETNADRIRAMTDEELADEILRWLNWLNAVEWDDRKIINWLKQEAKDG